MARDIILSEHQQAAVDAVRRKLAAGNRHVCLQGYAGTGKTTIAGVLMDHGSELLAPTGKAAARLSEKTGHAVSTIHKRCAKLRSERVEDGRDVLDFEPDPLKAEFRGLVMVDEGSMVGRGVGEMLDALVPDAGQVLWLQDPFQLPPVNDEPFIDFDPAYELTEVRRQEGGSPVLDYATEIRSGRRAIYDRWLFRSADEAFCSTWRGNIAGACGMFWRARGLGMSSIVLTHRNSTRLAINRMCRSARGVHPDSPPQAGDEIVCTRNHDSGLMNGETFTVQHAAPTVALCGGKEVQCYEVVINDGARYLVLPRHMTGVYQESESRDWMKAWRGEPPPEALICQYGYALTVHKSQGSEWDVVIHVPEPLRCDEDRLHYTAVTRAAKGYMRVDIGGSDGA